MTPAEISQYFAIALAALALLGHAKGYFSSSEKEVDQRLDAHEEDLKKHDRRIQAVENEMGHMPNTESIHKQQLDISDMKGEIGIIKKSIEATERTTRRVEDFLINRSGS